MRYALKFISGKYEGGVFKLPTIGEVVIGRSSNVDVVIVEDMVSRSHARLTFGKGGSLYIEDLQSTNGTRLDGVRIQGRAALSPSCCLQFADVQCLFEERSP